jgi:hypothetical protein
LTNAGIKWEVADDVVCDALSAPSFDSTASPDAWAPTPSIVE